jgi:hypothetical protein
MKILKWVVIILATIAIILFVFFKIMTGKADDRLEKSYQIEASLIPIPTDSISL